ncbi:VanZ family protein [Algoriphagus lacus]|uniref:VanZ family protein n=1 Tax=Algoriphagus lacus TaxID=2056311 RepID=A0A418PR52_9BACT|nr:VanZ family protein [Algoriphagus lacus]RIW15076.1 VanZ family protein [Algoriphagus lacus]
MKNLLKSTNLTLALCAIYLVALFWIIVLKFNISAYHAGVEQNWIPFPALFGMEGQGDRNELLLNVFIFIPFGCYVGILREKWSLSQKAGLFFSISFLFEISQYILKFGAFDATDLINNTLGGLLGLWVFQGLEKSLASRLKAQKIINLIALVGTVVIFFILLYLKVNNIWIFRMELLSR